MAEETNPVEETAQEAVEQTVEQQAEAPQEEAQQTETPSNVSVDEDGTIKLDLREQPKTEEDAVQEQSADEISVRDESETSGNVQEQNNGEANEESSGESDTTNNEDAVLELVQDEEPVEQSSLSDKIKDIPNKLKEETEDVNNNQAASELPENINKLVEFMRETGGDIEDYVNLNKNYDSMDDSQLLREYYQQTKPHLAADEIDFLIEDNFSYDEEVDEERDIKRKKLAFKESIAEAKSNLTNLKDKYYDDLKLSSKLSPEQKEAVEFYNDYKTNQTSTQQQRSVFEQKTNELFTN